jgi:sugar lactone lactonase YvrE
MLRNICFCAALVAAPAVAGEPVVIDGSAGFPEGPFFEDGVLYYAEYGAHEISAWDGSAVRTVWSEPGCGPSAVQRFAEKFLVTCYDSGTLAIVAADGSSATVIDKDTDGNPLLGPNDIALAGHGKAYVTVSGPWDSAPIVGKVLLVSADGAAKVVADDLHYANGLALSAEGSTLFVIEHYAARVIRFTVQGDGSLTDRALFVRMTDLGEPPDALPDGIKLGPDGNFYIGLYSAGRVLVVDAGGKLVRKIEVPAATAPNLTFSADGKTMFVMAVDDTANPPYAGKVFSVPLE